MSLSTRYRVVIDTNVFISGLVFGGNVGKIVDWFRELKIEVLMSPQIAAELHRKLSDFEIDEDVLEEFWQMVNEKVVKLWPKKAVAVVRDPKDNMFLELAWAGRADYLVTGDKDLLTLHEFKGTKIVKPKEFMEEIGR